MPLNGSMRSSKTNETCSEPNCPNKAMTSGLCRRHYYRQWMASEREGICQACGCKETVRRITSVNLSLCSWCQNQLRSIPNSPQQPLASPEQLDALREMEQNGTLISYCDSLILKNLGWERIGNNDR
jgi:hypothetical protein